MSNARVSKYSIFSDILKYERWTWIVGGTHALVGSAILFLSIHPLRAYLEPQLLELAVVGSALQAIQGGALLVLSRHSEAKWPALLIAGGTAGYSAMLYFIIFTGLHPFDPLVPMGGLAMLLGWIMVIFTKPGSHL